MTENQLHFSKLRFKFQYFKSLKKFICIIHSHNKIPKFTTIYCFFLRRKFPFQLLCSQKKLCIKTRNLFSIFTKKSYPIFNLLGDLHEKR